MNRGSMRSMLRRRLNESSADYWQDTDLNDLLASAALDVQSELVKRNPHACLSWLRTPLTAGENFYPKPIGLWWEFEFGVKVNSTDTSYTILGKQPYKLLRDAAGGVAGYASMGRFFAVYPTPTFTDASGIQIVGTMAVTMDTDNTVPDLHLSLHKGIVVRAHALAMMEEGESPRFDLVAKEWEDELKKIALVATGGMGDIPHVWIDPSAIGRQS